MMNQVTKLIFEGIVSGKIDRTAGTEMLKAIKEDVAKKVKDIAIIGVSAKLGKSDRADDFWANIRDGADCITAYPESRKRLSRPIARHLMDKQDEELLYNEGAFLENIDKFDYPYFRIPREEAELMDPNQRLFLQTAWEAIEDAGYGGGQLAGSDTGVYIGFNDWPMYGHYIAKVDSSLGPGSVAGNLASIIAGRISYLLDLKGPSLLVDTACSSSLVAFHLACQAIRNGDCRMAVAGGVKLNLLPLTGFRIGIESEDYRTRSFDDSSDGTAWGEGVAAVLLKPLHLALQDRDSIYAVVKGSAVNQDGSSVGLTAPNALAQEAVIAKAWEDAGIDPESISYVEAHGTGTKLGDPVEINGLQRAFRRYTDKKQFCAIGSVKSNIGHLDSAAGIASIVKAVMALKHKELPASLHFQKPNRRIDFISSPVYVLHRRRPWTTDGFPRRCGISSFGFSGTNCHVILEEAPEIGKSSEGSGASYPVMLSAQSESALRTLIRRYVDFLGRHPDTNLADFSYTAAVGRGHYRYRLAAVAESARELRLKLETFTAGGSELHSMPHKQLFYGVRRTGYGDRTENGDLAQQEPVVRGNDNVGIDSHMLERMCRLYAHGEDVEWERVYEGQERYRISLPPYPFEKHACWFAPADELAGDDVNCHDRSCDANHIGNVGSAAYEEPSSGLERQLADIWKGLLGLERVGANDDFYELGGSSLDAMRLEVEVTKVIPGLQNMTIYSNLNHYPTVKQLAAFLRENP